MVLAALFSKECLRMGPYHGLAFRNIDAFPVSPQQSPDVLEVLALHDRLAQALGDEGSSPKEFLPCPVVDAQIGLTCLYQGFDGIPGCHSIGANAPDKVIEVR